VTTRTSPRSLFVLLIVLAVTTPGVAGAQTETETSWVTAPGRLQSIVDATYGAGHIDVRTDYLGAREGDADRIVWMNAVWPILQVREIAGAAHRTCIGWYIESGDPQRPVLDGIDDGPVYKNQYAPPATSVLQFRSRGRGIGFYFRSPDAGGGLGPRTFFTNRTYNDTGSAGWDSVLEPPAAGDVQALVFDVSAWTRPRTWLVCFESHDAGLSSGTCCNEGDNDYADYVFEVRAEAVTATLAPSFGSLKRVYRD